MNPENRDRLLRAGEVLPAALADPNDFETIAKMCTVEFALRLLSQNAAHHRLLSGRDPVTCSGQGIAKTMLLRGARFLDFFVANRMALSATGVTCEKPIHAGQFRSDRSCHQQSSSGINAVESDFTVVEWNEYQAHHECFPHMVLLVRQNMPRVYSVLPMGSSFLLREDMAFEAAKIYSIYSGIDVCLVLDPERCVYVRKDGTYMRSGNRPKGGALAHLSVTGPHLYSLHLEALQATLRDRPDAFPFHDDFDACLGRYTGQDYSLVEPIFSPSGDTRDQVADRICQVVSDFLPVFGREWEDTGAGLEESTLAWLQALDIPGRVRIVTKEDTQTLCQNPLSASQLFEAPLYSVLDGTLDVMEFDLKRAGLYEIVNILLEPAYTAAHIGYLRLLTQCERIAGLPDNEMFWDRIGGLLLPAAICSPVTLIRLEAWRRIEPLYRKFVPSTDTDRGSYARAQRVQTLLPLLAKVNECGPRWMIQTGEEVQVLPATVVRLDEEGEPHSPSEGEPAIIDPDGTRTFTVQGEED